MEQILQLTKEQAISIAKSGMWKNWTHEERFKFQLFQGRLCMDFSAFHESAEKVLGRPVFTHEFALSNLDNIIKEYLGEKPAPTFEEIVSMIPKEKLIVLEG